MGEEVKKWEKELKEEKERDNIIEEKIRNMRKQVNKARPITEKSDRNKPASKRQRTGDESYFSIRDTWGAPTITAPKKTLAENLEEDQPNKKRRKTEKDITNEKITNCVRIEDKVIEGEEIDMKNYEKEITDINDWNEKIKQHQEELEKETREREEIIKRKEKKE